MANEPKVTMPPIIDSIPNLRDAGGYATGDGRRVRTGLLYRSEQLSHVTDWTLCTITAADLKVLIDEARTLHTQQLEAADLEPPTHARRLSNGKLRLLFGAPAVNLGDVVEVDVDEVERERWRRMPVLPDHIQVARGEYNDLLRLRNVLADFASSVGDSTIGRMIAAHVNNPTSIIKLEEIR